MLLLVIIEGGASHPAIRWSFVGAGGLWLAVMLAGGPLGRPTARLTGLPRALPRALFLPFHLALHAALAAAVGLNALALTGRASDDDAFTALLFLLAMAAFHAVFHLWRHTVPGDGALKMMTPRRMHRHLYNLSNRALRRTCERPFIAAQTPLRESPAAQGGQRPTQGRQRPRHGSEQAP